MGDLVKGIREFVPSVWWTLASGLGLLTLATWLRGDIYPTVTLDALLKWLGVKINWPNSIHAWLNTSGRQHDIDVAVQAIAAFIVIAAAHHSWTKADSFGLFQRVCDSAEDTGKASSRLIRYDSSRHGQTYASLWVIFALAAEVGVVTPSRVAVLILVLALQSLLSLRMLDDRSAIARLAFPAILLESAMAAMILVALPLLLTMALVIPRHRDFAIESES